MINIDYLLQLHLIGKKPKKQEENPEEPIEPSEPIQIGKVYGVVIDKSIPNSYDAVSYTDDAIGLSSAKGNNGKFDYGSWKDRFPFNQIKPCKLKDGIVSYYLDPDDYTKKLDGSPADIVTGEGGEVMVEFPTIYWKIETANNKVYVKYSDVRIDSTYQALAHQRSTTIADKVYISAYLTSTSTLESHHQINVPISLSGLKPYTSFTRGNIRDRLTGNNTYYKSGYEMFGFYQLVMLQILYLVMFKDLNSKKALGLGFQGTANFKSIVTGHLNNKGMYYGTNDDKTGVKFCGIEDFYGGFDIYVDGILVDQQDNIKIGVDNFSESGDGYVTYGKISSSSITGYLKDVAGTTNLGFIPTTVISTDEDYYGVYAYVKTLGLGVFGTNNNSSRGSGTFAFELNPNKYSNAYVGSRLMFRH